MRADVYVGVSRALVCALVVCVGSSWLAGCGEDTSRKTTATPGETTGEVTMPPVSPTPTTTERMRRIGGAQPDGSVLRDVVVLDWGESAPDVLIEQDQLSVPLSGNEALLGLKDGELIASRTNRGFLRRALYTRARDGRVVIDTEPAALSDVVVRARLEEGFDLSVSPAPVPGALVGAGYDFSGAKLEVAGGGGALGAQVQRGFVRYNPKLRIDGDWEEGGLTWMELALVGPLELDLAVSVTARLDGTSDPLALLDREFKFVSFIGLLPVVWIVRAKLEAKLQASVEVGGLIDFGGSLSAQVGGQLRYDEASGLSALDLSDAIKPEATTPSFNGVTASVAVELNPSLEVMVYGVAGPVLQVPARIEARAGQHACDSGVTSRVAAEMLARLDTFGAKFDASLPPFLFFEHKGVLRSPAELPSFQSECCLVPLPYPGTLPTSEWLASCDQLAANPQYSAPQTLTIRDAPADARVVVIPRLQHIDGDLEIDVKDSSINLPELRSISGDLTLRLDASSPGQGPPVALLPALERVGGAVFIELMTRGERQPEVVLSSLHTVGANSSPERPPGGVSVLATGPLQHALKLPNLSSPNTIISMACGGQQGITQATSMSVHAPRLTEALGVSVGVEELGDAPVAITRCELDLPALTQIRAFTYVVMESPGEEPRIVRGGGQLNISGDVVYHMPSLVAVERQVSISGSEQGGGHPQVMLDALKTAGSVHIWLLDTMLPQLTLGSLERVGAMFIGMRSLDRLSLPRLEHLGFYEGETPELAAFCAEPQVSCRGLGLSLDEGLLTHIDLPALTRARDLGLCGALNGPFSAPALVEVSSLGLCGDALSQVELPNLMKIEREVAIDLSESGLTTLSFPQLVQGGALHIEGSSMSNADLLNLLPQPGAQLRLFLHSDQADRCLIDALRARVGGGGSGSGLACSAGTSCSNGGAWPSTCQPTP